MNQRTKEKMEALVRALPQLEKELVDGNFNHHGTKYINGFNLRKTANGKWGIAVLSNDGTEDPLDELGQILDTMEINHIGGWASTTGATIEIVKNYDDFLPSEKK